MAHGLLIERCRFLEAAGCASVCMNTCKARNDEQGSLCASLEQSMVRSQIWVLQDYVIRGSNLLYIMAEFWDSGEFLGVVFFTLFYKFLYIYFFLTVGIFLSLAFQPLGPSTR